MPLPIIPIALGAAVVALLLANNSSGGDAKPGGGGGGGGVDLLTCEQAFALLPKEVRDPIIAALASPTFSAAQRETIAQQLEAGAAGMTDLKLRNAFNVAASCVRATALGGGGAAPPPGGGGGTDLINCATAFAGLPPTVLAMVEEARSRTDPAARLAMAKILEDSAPAVTDPTMRQRMLTAASCLRGEAATGAKEVFQPGHAVPPDRQILYTVRPGDSASRITAVVWGSAKSSPTTWSQLIQLNPRESQTGRDMGITGTYGTNSYNWTSLRAGDILKIPKSWNVFIDDSDGEVRTPGIPLPPRV